MPVQELFAESTRSEKQKEEAFIVKAVIRYEDGRLQQREFTVAPSETTRFASPMAGVGPLAIGTPVAFELWLTAQDGVGRRLVSRYRIPL